MTIDIMNNFGNGTIIILCLLMVGMLSGCVGSVEPDISGVLIQTANPCTTDPCLPGIVWAIEKTISYDNKELYYLYEDNFLWGDNDIEKYGSFSENDVVGVYGTLDVKYDIYSNPYNIIYVEKIERLPPVPC